MRFLTCNRVECPEVRCDRYSEVYGYICDSCFGELAALGMTDVGEFMDTPAKRGASPAAWLAFLDVEFSKTDGAS